MDLDDSVRIYKFTDLNKGYILRNKDEIEKYILEHYGFYNEFLALN